MAVLSDVERAALRAAFAAESSQNRTVLVGMTKTDLRAAVDAADAWADANAASYAAALPTAFRTNTTAKQKAQLLMYVIRRRYEVS